MKDDYELLLLLYEEEKCVFFFKLKHSLLGV
jgi:hypothetical protein